MEVVLLLFQLAVLLMSVVLHEFAHGWAAYRLGDPTAKGYGRLTLNPLKHLDWFGSVLLPLGLFIFTGGRAIFGWAKPVPFNPYNLRDQRWGPAKVAVAGPAANVAIAFVFGLSLRFLPASFLSVHPAMVEAFSIIVILNILLAVFNLIPIPPLDGSKILFAFLPYRLINLKRFLEDYGMFLLLFFIFFAFQWLLPFVFLVYYLIVGSSFFG